MTLESAPLPSLKEKHEGQTQTPRQSTSHLLGLLHSETGRAKESEGCRKAGMKKKGCL